MFTGIVENLGTVQKISPDAGGVELLIHSDFPQKYLKKGTSVLVNGVCLTVEKSDSKKKEFTLHLVEESLARTAFKSVKLGDKVNLESSLTLNKALAGHLVLGHIDFTARVLREAPLLELEIPKPYCKYFPEKGSITVHGVSLTIAKRSTNHIQVALIPETLRSTNLASFKKGDSLNIEIDVLARYLESLLAPSL
jgi:riboflavin synthase